MAEFWKTKSFKITSKEWDKKLKQSGFIDDEEAMRKPHRGYEKASQLERELRYEYYSLIGHHVHNTEFPNILEKQILILHAEGFNISEISRELGDFKHFEKNRKDIRYIIRRWQQRWGIKRWSLKQLNLKRIP